ncbi:MAG: signal peptide peptidase SppA [Candidatus Binatia bacterium]
MGRLGRILRRLALGIFAAALLVALTRWLGSASGAGWLSGDLVAVVWVEGAIEESEAVVEALDDLAEKDSVDAVVLRVDSPGGAVAPSQEIYDAIGRLREKKPVIASLGNLAASGGYYVAAACDAIVANAGTLTGSIGVLMELPNVEELLRKVGLAGEVLKAGRYKDIGSPIRPMTPEEREIMQGLLANVHEQFVAAVAKGRKLEVEAIRPLADGRVFSGEQALEHGLVDRLGGLRDAVALAAERAGIVGTPKRIEFREGKESWFWGLVGRAVGSLPKGALGLQFLYLGPRSPG